MPWTKTWTPHVSHRHRRQGLVVQIAPTLVVLISLSKNKCKEPEKDALSLTSKHTRACALFWRVRRCRRCSSPISCIYACSNMCPLATCALGRLGLPLNIRGNVRHITQAPCNFSKESPPESTIRKPQDEYLWHRGVSDRLLTAASPSHLRQFSHCSFRPVL